MKTKTIGPRSFLSQFGSLVMLLVVGAGGAYAGMRWHAPMERWLMPSAASAKPEAAASVSPDKKQLWTCGMHPQVIQDHPGDCPICHMKLTPLIGAGASSSPGGAAAVVIDPAVVQNMGVRTVEVAEGRLGQSIRVFASLEEAEPAHRDVNLRVSGWIQTLYANTDGMMVKKGDPLFDLYSPELKLAIEELIAARRAVETAGSGAAGGLREMSESLVAAAESRLLALDLTPEQIREFGSMEHAPSVVTIVSPLDSHVTDKTGVYAGSAVTAGQRVFRLAQRTTMWVEARVPEGELGRVHVGQKMRARVDAYPGRGFEGEVIFIHPHLDEMTRTAMVRMALPNHDSALHEGMYATVDIEVGNGGPAVLVPREAVIDSGESQVVFVSTGSGRFEPRHIVMGQSGERGLVQVLSGLTPGEPVVVSGQFLLDSESRLREAITKFLGQKPGVVQTAGTMPAPVNTPTIVVAPEKVDAIIAAYLPLAESLGMLQTTHSPLKVDELVGAIHSLRGSVSTPEGLGLVAKAAGAAEAMREQPIEKQRDLFKAVSATLIAIVDAMPPSASVSGSLYVVNCPMATADWLQRTTDIANPYYADEMKDCGTVVRAVGASKGAP